MAAWQEDVNTASISQFWDLFHVRDSWDVDVAGVDSRMK